MAAAVDGAELNNLIWVRCGGDSGAALKSTGEILSAGGFGTVVLDLGGVARKDLEKDSQFLLAPIPAGCRAYGNDPSPAGKGTVGS